jgi:hypothetical protein
MAGTVTIIVLLVVFPVLVLMSGAIGAALIGWLLKTDRDDAYEGTEYLALANGPAAPAEE